MREKHEYIIHLGVSRVVHFENCPITHFSSFIVIHKKIKYTIIYFELFQLLFQHFLRYFIWQYVYENIQLNVGNVSR